MSFESFLYLLFLIVITALVEVALLIVNYKGRFKYGMYEQTSIWRWFDRQRRIVAYLYFPLSFIFTVVVVPFVLGMLAVIFQETLANSFNLSVPIELIYSSMLGALIGVLSFNVWMDRFSIKVFESCHMKCPHNRECALFRSERCIIPHVLHNSRALLRLLKGKSSEDTFYHKR